MGKVRKSRVKGARREEKWQPGVTFNEPEKVKGGKVISDIKEESLSVSTA